MRVVVGILFVTANTMFISSCTERTPFPTPVASPPVWRGITPGVTTEQQLVALWGQPSRKEQIGEFTWYAYPTRHGGEAWPDAAYVADGIVQMATESVDVSVKPYTSLSIFVARYGDPRKVTWTALLPQARTFVFPESGIAVVADHWGEPPERYRVWKIYYFVPMSLDSYMRIWGKLLPKENPYPAHDPYPEDFYHTPGATVTPSP